MVRLFGELFIVIALILFISLYHTNDWQEFLIYRVILLILLYPVIYLVLKHLFSDFKKIKLLDTEIILESIITGKALTIRYDQIKKIETRTLRDVGGDYPGIHSDGYQELTLNLKDDTFFTIEAVMFSNFTEMKIFIYEKYKSII